MVLQHPWLTRIRPTATYRRGGQTLELYAIAPTNLHRIAADVLILPTDSTMRMVRGVRKQVRDYGGFGLIEEEAIQCAPLPPQGIAITSGGRTKFRTILHPNLYDAQYTTDTELQRTALTNALRLTQEQGARVVAIADYTPDLRRALAEETAFTLLEAIAESGSAIPTIKLLCTDLVNAWVFQQIVSWVAQRGLTPYPNMVRVRHTMLHAVQAADWSTIPADGLWHFTDANLTESLSGLLRRGGPVLRDRMRESAPIAVGDATITSGGNLLQSFVVHLVVRPQPSAEVLRHAIDSALSLSHNQSLRTVLIPLPDVSMPAETIAQTLLHAFEEHLHAMISKIERAILLSTTVEGLAVWQSAVQALRERVSLPPLESPSGV